MAVRKADPDRAASAERRLAAQSRRQAKHKAAGLCRCGRSPEPDRKSCTACLADDRITAGRRYQRQRDRILLLGKAWRERNATQIKAASKAKRERDKARPDASRRQAERHYQRTFKLSVADVERMHAEQDGLCLICCESMAEKSGQSKSRLGHVDHCHVTGRVRGLLCLTCNAQAGILEMLVKKQLFSRMLAHILPPK